MAFDLAVIGAGPGGYVAAIRAAQLGGKAAVVERGEVGGVCLNRGCIPTKAMIACAHAMRAVRDAAQFGIIIEGTPSVDMKKVQARKDAIVSKLRSGVAGLIKGRGIEVIKGSAAFAGPGRIAVDGKAIEAKNILIATGSSWIDLPDLATDGRTIVTSDEALGWAAVPARLVIVGGGVIGCEFACMMAAFGSKVTVVEAMPSILPPVEKAVSRLLARAMKGQGIEIIVGTTVEKAKAKGDEVELMLSTGEARAADRMLVAVGRRPMTKGLCLEAAGISLTDRGFIKVDERFRTTASNVYAIGDVIGNPMLAHAASREGIAAVEGIFGHGAAYNPNACPSPIFTMPEIGAVGMTAEELTAAGIAFKTGRFPYAATAKALCDGCEEGQAIVHADESGKILGVHIIGREATTIIAEAALAIANGLTVKGLRETIHAHPTLPEVLAEAAEDVDGMAIHKMGRAR